MFLFRRHASAQLLLVAVVRECGVKRVSLEINKLLNEVALL
jgi:hypothetical protein